jgi:hypothetical protein
LLLTSHLLNTLEHELIDNHMSNTYTLYF